MKKLINLLFIFVCLSACIENKTEKKQSSRDNVVNVYNKVHLVKIDTVLLSLYSKMSITDRYLLIKDSHSCDKVIHIFDKNDFKYIKSIGQQGPGPEEITYAGNVTFDKKRNKIYVNDDDKMKIYSFDLDSAIIYPNYVPIVTMKLKKVAHSWKYIIINDTLSIGMVITSSGNSQFNEELARINFSKDKIVYFKYTQPDIIKKRICFAISEKDGLCAECYYYNDLMTITDLYGNLKYNIYGPSWKNENNRHNFYQFYHGVVFYKDKIIAGYAEGKTRRDNKVNFMPAKLLVFSKNGDYIKTLDVGYHMFDFVYDKENDRLILDLEDENEKLAYLDMKDLKL